MKKHDSPQAINAIGVKYYPSFSQRISAAGRLLNADADRKLIIKLRSEIELLACKFQAVFETTNDHFIILDRELNTVEFNKSSSQLIKKLFGKKMTIGENISNFVHPKFAKTIIAGCDKAFAGEKVYLERKMDCADNKITWWLFEFRPVSNLRGNITDVMLNFKDINKRKTDEAKILAQRKKLSEISSIQSHQIRGPVCTIMGIMSLIKESEYEPNREYLMLLENSVNMLDKNIHDIVDLTNDE